jgi:hypothetical protein
MKNKYFLFLFALVLISGRGLGQDIANHIYHVKGAVPKAQNAERTMSTNSVYLNYIQADSVYFPRSYFMSYMFEMNSRYSINDTGSHLANEYLIQSFGVMFDSIIDSYYKDTTYNLNIVRGLTIDSLSIIIGQNNYSGTQDTIIVQIDSVDRYGYPTSKVFHADTVLTGITGLSASNDWLNPFNLVIKKNFPVALNSNQFAVNVFYYGSKFDTMGFLPGFGDTTCHFGGPGIIPRETHIGNDFGGLKVNSFSSGYKYFFNNTMTTIPDSTGNTYGININCANPQLHYWYLQDNPISAFVTFTNVTGINEPKFSESFEVGQNQPNPFNKTTQIIYSLKNASNVEFRVYDMAGRELLNDNYGMLPQGSHSISLDASLLGPGIYFYTFNVNGASVTRKMVITQ